MNPLRLIFALLLSLGSVPTQAAPPVVGGDWKWTMQRQGEAREITMKLKQDGSKIGGVIAGPDGREVEIREGKISDDGRLTFAIQFERDGNTMKIDFEGKAANNTISGRTKYVNPEGEARERDWVATRAGQNLTGAWVSTFKRQDGTAIETTLNLKHEGGRLTGKTVSPFGESEIHDGKVQNGEVSFKTVRDRDGRTITTKYHGKLQPDHSIKGRMESDWSGEVRARDWEAKRK